MKGTLYIVGTPIGNLGDLSPRAVETLDMVDFIAAEDTRVTLKLLNHFGIRKSLISYFEHNKIERGRIILDRILAGENCALVSDAGMPAISDPGELLVSQCAELGVQVLVVPGPSALTAALTVSGLPTGRFTFEGFLSTGKKSRRDHLNEVRTEKRTMIFYEAPHKLPSTIHDMLACWGDRRIAIVREITKIHEEVIRTTLEKADQMLQEDRLKGEIVLIIEGAREEAAETGTLEDAVELARRLTEENLSASEASKKAAALTGMKKGDIYRRLMEET